jgi:hypothetical protein
VPVLRWESILLAALILLIFTGLLEEFIFRGLQQSTALPILGRYAIPFVAAVFAVLHLGYRSALDVLFVFGVALFFGWIVQRSGSILGVSLSHGLTNISLYLIFPLLLTSVGSYHEIPIKITEVDVNEVIQNAKTGQDSPFRIENLDMKDGYMRIFMSYRKGDGSYLLGSYDVAFDIENGKVTAKIVKLDMPGLSLDDETLRYIAQLITKHFSYTTANIGDQVEFVYQKMNRDSLDLVIRIKR